MSLLEAANLARDELEEDTTMSMPDAESSSSKMPAKKRNRRVRYKVLRYCAVSLRGSLSHALKYAHLALASCRADLLLKCRKGKLKVNSLSLAWSCALLNA
jgi:hypothetical protein